jgi:hypothetical protein
VNRLLNEGNCFNLRLNKKRLEEIAKRHPVIYRYVPIDRMLQLLQKKQMAFISPRKWSDPFDNFLFRVLNKAEMDGSFLDSICVLCFTLNPHSQAYWQNYASDTWAARLQIRTHEFLECLLEANENVWLGRVKYIAESALRARLKNKRGLKSALTDKSPNRVFIDFFHLKRWPFKYEDEIRIMLHCQKVKDGVKKIDVDAPKIIKSIRLDPRMSIEEAIVLKEYIGKFGIEVTKSQLFTKRSIKIQ